MSWLRHKSKLSKLALSFNRGFKHRLILMGMALAIRRKLYLVQFVGSKAKVVNLKMEVTRRRTVKFPKKQTFLTP